MFETIPRKKRLRDNAEKKAKAQADQHAAETARLVAGVQGLLEDTRGEVASKMGATVHGLAQVAAAARGREQLEMCVLHRLCSFLGTRVRQGAPIQTRLAGRGDKNMREATCPEAQELWKHSVYVSTTCHTCEAIHMRVSLLLAET